MSVIPIDPKQVVTHTDENGGKWFLRYVTGEYRAKYDATRNFTANIVKNYRDPAEKAVEKALKNNPELIPSDGVEDQEGERNRMVYEKAVELAVEDGAMTEVEQDRKIADLVDVFLCGWDGKGFPKYDPKKKPSEYFTSVQLVELVEMIAPYIGELTGLTVADRKN